MTKIILFILVFINTHVLKKFALLLQAVWAKPYWGLAAWPLFTHVLTWLH